MFPANAAWIRRVGWFLAIATPVLAVAVLWAWRVERRKPLVALAGDSLVSSHSWRLSSHGWGEYLAGHLGRRVRVENFARGGKSTETFLREEWWDATLRARPAVVLIEFGHNDEAGAADVRTTPERFAENLSRMAREARDAGAAPIFVTPVAQRKFKATGELDATLAERAATMREAAEKLGVGVIDLHAISAARLGAMGLEAAEREFGLPPRPDGRRDDTHQNEREARWMARCVADELRNLAPWLFETGVEPSSADCASGQPGPLNSKS